MTVIEQSHRHLDTICCAAIEMKIYCCRYPKVDTDQLCLVIDRLVCIVLRQQLTTLMSIGHDYNDTVASYQY
jgi:hypothetical protein